MDDLISRQEAIRIASGYCHPANIAEELAKLPSVEPDLSEYSDKLWKAAYERGRAEAQPEIIRCKDCKHRDPEDRKCDCGHDILWQLPRQDDWYCADAERRTE